MDARLQRRVQRYGWDKASSFYEQFWATQLAPAQARLLELADLRPGDEVLDVACGTGLVTFRAASAVGATGRAVGVDLSEDMVTRAAADPRAAAGHVRFERMDAERLDLPDASFDVVLCALGLMYVPEPANAMTEMRRVLRPGGRAAALVWGVRSRCGWAEIFPIVDRRVASDVCPVFFQLGTGDSLAAVMTSTGFTDVRAERIDATIHYASAEEAIGAAFLGGPVALAYSRFDQPTRDAVHAEYIASLDRFRRGNGYDVPGEFVVVTACRPSEPAT